MWLLKCINLVKDSLGAGNVSSSFKQIWPSRYSFELVVKKHFQDFTGGCNEDNLWQPWFLGQIVVVLSSTPGFWDLAKTNSAIYCVLFFGWDVIDSASLLQISGNILKTDGDNQCFLASISSITQHDCNILSVNRNRMSCWNLFYQPLLVIS